MRVSNSFVSRSIYGASPSPSPNHTAPPTHTHQRRPIARAHRLPQRIALRDRQVQRARRLQRRNDSVNLRRRNLRELRVRPRPTRRARPNEARLRQHALRSTGVSADSAPRPRAISRTSAAANSTSIAPSSCTVEASAMTRCVTLRARGCTRCMGDRGVRVRRARARGTRIHLHLLEGLAGPRRGVRAQPRHDSLHGRRLRGGHGHGTSLPLPPPRPRAARARYEQTRACASPRAPPASQRRPCARHSSSRASARSRAPARARATTRERHRAPPRGTGHHPIPAASARGPATAARRIYAPGVKTPHSAAALRATHAAGARDALLGKRRVAVLAQSALGRRVHDRPESREPVRIRAVRS